MPKKTPLTKNEKRLLRRYLIWSYKTTKEELDRIDRYFTQLKADAFVLLKLRKSKEYKSSVKSGAYKEIVEQFQEYMSVKKANVLKKKFRDTHREKLDPGYQYLQNRFTAIEQAIVHFLGKNELTEICSLYEEEMTNRILQAKEHS